jgi:hypothetical protein
MGVKNMNKITNVIISLAAFLAASMLAYATGIDLVVKVIFLAFAIQWVAFIPAYVFQTEKFYDLTGSPYLFVCRMVFTLLKLE